MNIVVFGLTISSSWGNGHATLWRGLSRALDRQGHRLVFFEHDRPYYAANRDCFDVPGGKLVLYAEWESVRDSAAREIRNADAVIVTSYCSDAIAASSLALENGAYTAFYDLDTPITLSRLSRGERIEYLGPRGLADFDLVLSFTGGGAIEALRGRLHARRVVPLYGHVDPDVHTSVPAVAHYRSDLSYLGTYSSDRQAALAALFVEPARQRPNDRFLIAGAQYPNDFPWTSNIYFVRHLPPFEHPAFFCSSRLTLNVTRAPMAAMGWCPSGRLFEAAACGAGILSDRWEGLETFFSPGEEIFVADDTKAAVAVLGLDDAEIRRAARAARERTLAEHTSQHRARELVAALEQAKSRQSEHVGA